MYRKSVKTLTSKESHNLIKAQKLIMVSPEIKRLRTKMESGNVQQLIHFAIQF